MLENPLDRSMTSCSRLMGLKEEFQGQTLKTYHTDNYFSRNEGPLCLRDNLKEDGIKVLARFDNFTPSRAQYKIHPLTLRNT
jgi:hypothetical protein